MEPASGQKIRVLIVDDHQVVRLGLRTLLGRHPALEVVGEAGSVATSIEEAERLRPDLVLMDVRLPDGKGYEACRQIHRLVPESRVLFLTSFADEQVVLESLDAGGDGYLLKEIDEQALLRAIESVAQGQSILDPAITRSVLERARTPGSPPQQSRWESLAPQELKVLALVADGKTNKEIGVALGLSDKTVKNYLSNALEKLQLTRRSQAAAFYVQHSRR
jgi:two-component system, NarL family, response regulator DevR